MAHLNENLNVNHVWRNQFMNCGRVLHRDRGGPRLLANAEPGEAADLDRVLTSDSPAGSAAALDRAGIPFAELGLYRDAWRATLPTSTVQQLRRDD